MTETFQFHKSHLLTDNFNTRVIVFYSESLLYQWIHGYYTTFISLRFSVSGLMLRYLIDLELSFVQGGKHESIGIILHAANMFNLHHLFKKHSFFQCVFMTSLSKIRYP